MMGQNPKIRIGTCSWKYDSWRDIVYSDQAKQNYLKEYAQKFDTVEIDQWFWSLFGIDKISLPDVKIVKEYAESVPPDFKFSIKVPNSISLTHFYRKNKSDELIKNPHFLSLDLFNSFLTSLEPMHNKIGILMFQFEYLNKQKMATQELFLGQFEEFILNCDKKFQYGVEIRNPYYLNKRYFELLKRNNLGHVFLQGYYMPDVVQPYAKYESLINQTTVIRLHGSDRSEIEKISGGNWSKIYESKDDELSRIAQIIEDIHSKNLDIYVNVNNHYEGSAPLTIEKIRNILFSDL